MKRFSKFSKIMQFRDTFKEIQRVETFVGLDEKEEPIYDKSLPLPTLKFKGTIKLHGTNGGIGYDLNSKELWAQTRRESITVEKDNYRFANYLETNKEYFLKIFDEMVRKGRAENFDFETVIIYGEWAGKGIQRGVAISQLEKAFFVFGIKFIKGDSHKWINLEDYIVSSPEQSLYVISDYPTYEIDIDFSNPQKAVDRMTEWVDGVEKECPVANSFGVSGIGEGIVFTGHYKGERYVFKVKGEKHSTVKTKERIPISPEKLESINNFIDYAVTENRMNQGVKEVFGEAEPDIRKMGSYLKWVANDVMSEEMDMLVENSLEVKDVTKHISTRARTWLLEKLNSFE